MRDRSCYLEHAVTMAQRQAQALLHGVTSLTSSDSLADIITLIHDYLDYLNQPESAIELALGLD